MLQSLIPGAVETLFQALVLLGWDMWLLSDGCPGVSSHLARGVKDQPHSLFSGSCLLMGISLWCVLPPCLEAKSPLLCVSSGCLEVTWLRLKKKRVAELS